MKVRYFCANCGAEVGLREITCPSCKRGFLSVKCPRCGFKGEAELFVSGCPACGYLGGEEAKREPAKAVGRRTRRSRHVAQKGEPAYRGLSTRFYRLAGIALVAVIAALLVLLLLR